LVLLDFLIKIHLFLKIKLNQFIHGYIHQVIFSVKNNSFFLLFLDLLIKGRVEYTVKMLGHVDVSNSKGTAVVQDAIAKLRLQALTKQNETGQIPKSRKVRKI